MCLEKSKIGRALGMYHRQEQVRGHRVYIAVKERAREGIGHLSQQEKGRRALAMHHGTRKMEKALRVYHRWSKIGRPQEDSRYSKVVVRRLQGCDIWRY